MMFWMVLACSHPEWNEVLKEHRARLDIDHDGRVSAAEYEKTLWNGPPFGSADRDGDGDLSASELEWLIRGQSATAFDGPAGLDPVKQGGAGVEIPPEGVQNMQELLGWMQETLQQAGQTVPDPTAAMQSGRLDSPETGAWLQQIRGPWMAQGWSWPAGVP